MFSSECFWGLLFFLIFDLAVLGFARGCFFCFFCGGFFFKGFRNQAYPSECCHPRGPPARELRGPAPEEADSRDAPRSSNSTWVVL